MITDVQPVLERINLKILISPGYGAGWSTWNDAAVGRYVLTYQPIIEALERGEDITNQVKQLEKEIQERFDYCLYTGGASQLVVTEVETPFVVEEYDGSEYIVTPKSMNWITE